MSPTDELRAALESLGPGFHEVPREEIDRDPAGPPPLDFAPLRAAGHQAVTWILDAVCTRTDDPEDLAAIRRVRAAVDATARGGARTRRAQLAEADVLTVVGLLIVTFEREFNLAGLAHLAGGLYEATNPVLDRVLAELARAGRAAPTTAPTCPRRVPIQIHRRPAVAHSADDDGHFPFLTFR
ncbi:MAG: hypothetical protein IPL61_12600 [Myxococcales bacterium]|nr:hypothetical protein [Myxococcales bacterium]